MRMLLDTNALIGVLGDHDLPGNWRQLLIDVRNQVFVSSISLAELAVKASIGKLEEPPGSLAGVPASLGMDELSFTARHAECLLRLPLIHRDPFDRMLIAQALVEDLAIMTTDRAFAAYDVRLVAEARG